MLKITLILVVFVIASCWSETAQNRNQNQPLRNNVQNDYEPQINNQNQQNAEPELTLRMERFSWTGDLMYKLEIQPDGKVIFEGTNYKKTKGRAERKLEKEKMNQLLTEIENSDYFSLDAAYGYRFKNCQITMSDDESVKIYINLNEKEKTITHDLGCLDMSVEEVRKGNNWKDRIFPQKLYKLENKIDEIVETKHWIGQRK